MRIRRALSAFIVGSALSAASHPTKASIQIETFCETEPTGEDCDCDGNEAQQSECFCQAVWGQGCQQVTVEVGIMPTPVFRFFDGTHHLF